MRLEFRISKHAQIRAHADGKGITGYAAVFNSLSEDLGGFFEELDPKCFDDCLASNPDCRCLFNHDPNIIFGRTRSKTLSLGTDTRGLRFDCSMPETQAARDFMISCSRKDIDQCSFGFVVRAGGEDWREDKRGDGSVRTIRRITACDVFDVSPVTYAAYPATAVEINSQAGDSMRSFAVEIPVVGGSRGRSEVSAEEIERMRMRFALARIW
jgi:HK97 family phage prohead protease